MPRTRIAEVLRFVNQVSEKYKLVIGNMFHAGDGNLHPCILFDLRDADQVQRTHAAGNEILRYCIEVRRVHHRRARSGDGEERDHVRPVHGR